MCCFLLRATHPAAALSAVQRPSSVIFLQVEKKTQSDLVLGSLVLYSRSEIVLKTAGLLRHDGLLEFDTEGYLFHWQLASKLWENCNLISKEAGPVTSAVASSMASELPTGPSETSGKNYPKSCKRHQLVRCF